MNEWTTRPSLNEKKGSLAGATLNDKIYAVGGGSDNEFSASVEMLDLDVGAWIPSRSMLEKVDITLVYMSCVMSDWYIVMPQYI